MIDHNRIRLKIIKIQDCYLLTRGIVKLYNYLHQRAGITQLVEYELPKLRVAGSNPVARSIDIKASQSSSL